MEFRFKAGRLPMLVSMPHAGTDIPDEVAHTLAPCAAARNRPVTSAAWPLSSIRISVSSTS